jgi:hypothetical protein
LPPKTNTGTAEYEYVYTDDSPYRQRRNPNRAGPGARRAKYPIMQEAREYSCPDCGKVLTWVADGWVAASHRGGEANRSGAMRYYCTSAIGEQVRGSRQWCPVLPPGSDHRRVRNFVLWMDTLMELVTMESGGKRNVAYLAPATPDPKLKGGGAVIIDADD